MNASDRRGAEAVLRHLLVGRFVCGIQFYHAQPSLLVDDTDDEAAPVDGEVRLLIGVGTRWHLFDARPEALPASEEELGEWSLAELARIAGLLQPHRIVSASLAETVPHLLVGFESGHTLFVNGHHEQYEMWEVGATTGPDAFLVVACPDDEVAVWAPSGFPTRLHASSVSAPPPPSS